VTAPFATNDAASHLFIEIDHLMLQDKLSSAQAKIIFLLLYKTGMTVSEISSLTLGQINLDEGYVLLPKDKSRASRKLPLLPDVKDLLSTYLRNRNTVSTSHVLISRESSSMSDRRIQQIVRTSALRLIGKDLSPHDLRAAYIRNEIAAGTPIPVIEQRTGLASISAYVYAYLASRQP
jgi:site-specific recombinase XerD